jgi:hypothetical protein
MVTVMRIKIAKIPKFKKHPAKMTSNELAEGVFHPKVLEAAKLHLEHIRIEDAKKSVKAARKLRKSTT